MALITKPIWSPDWSKKLIPKNEKLDEVTKVWDEVAGEYVSKTEYDFRKSQREKTKSLEKFPLNIGQEAAQTTEEPPRPLLTSEEKRKQAEANPNTIINKYGDVIPQGTETMRETRKQDLTKEALGVKTDAQIIAERSRSEQIQVALDQAEQGLLTREELLNVITGSNINEAEALGAGTLKAVPGLIAAGTALGLSATGLPAFAGIPISTIAVGAAGKAFLDGYNGAMSNINAQQMGEFAADKEILTKGRTALNLIIADTNQNPQNAEQNIAKFYEIVQAIDIAHAKTWKDSQEDLNLMLGNDGTPQLAKFEAFELTLKQFYINKMNQAALNPNPNKAIFSNEELSFIQQFAIDQSGE